MIAKDISGQRFGKLVALRPTQERHPGKSGVVWECRCDCGNTVKETVGLLSYGTRISCGCGKHRKGRWHPKHGKGGTVTNHIWGGMLDRCSNPKHPKFHNYGGRGIAVCERWLTFENFLADMGERPPGLSLDRIDPDKGYEKSNCRWATPQTQGENTRRAIRVLFNGEQVVLKELAAKIGVRYERLHEYHRKRGMALEDAVRECLSRSAKPLPPRRRIGGHLTMIKP